jgi:protein SCO1/2
MKVLDSRPGKSARIISSPWFWAVMMLLCASVPVAHALGRRLPDPPAVYQALPNFKLIDDKGRPFGLDDLRGTVWVANFAFTSCPSVCPRLMERMGEVQHRTRNAPAVRLVTFTVDPEVDTPERLFAYGRRFKASPARWSLLTGDTQAVQDTIVKGFKLAVGDKESAFQIIHSERMVLVDREGNIRGYYEATDAGIEALARDISLVLNLG